MTWVCRRLALLEKFFHEAREDLRLGLLSPTIGRQLVRLPAGNQAEALAAARRESLTAEELRGVVDLLLASGTREKTAFVLEKPRQALQQAEQPSVRSWDPRLSSAGNRVNRQLGLLLDQLGRMENWLHHRGRGELALCVGDVGQTANQEPGNMNSEIRNEIIRRWYGGQSMRGVAREMKIARKTLKDALELHELQRQQGAVPAQLQAPPARRGSLVDPHVERIRNLLSRYPKITVRRIQEELQGHGYAGGYSILCERVAQLRPQPQTPWIERFETG